MIDTVLRLKYLNDRMAVYVGDSIEHITDSTMFGDMETDLHFPCLQLSKEQWEDHRRPVVLHIKVTDNGQ